MTLFYRILNYKFMHILCFDSIGRKYFVIFTVKFINSPKQARLLVRSSPSASLMIN